MGEFTRRAVIQDMRTHVLIAALLLSVPISLNAGPWEVTARLHKLKWGAGYVEAYSDPGPLVSVGYSLTERLAVEGEIGQVSSRFRGFRSPSGGMDSRFRAIAAKYRFPIAPRVSGFVAGGVAEIKHDDASADDGRGAQVGVGAEVTLSHRFFLRIDGRYLDMSGGSEADVENPKTLFTGGVGLRFGRQN
jgi:hypothetical protein